VTVGLLDKAKKHLGRDPSVSLNDLKSEYDKSEAETLSQIERANRRELDGAATGECPMDDCDRQLERVETSTTINRQESEATGSSVGVSGSNITGDAQTTDSPSVQSTQELVRCNNSDGEGMGEPECPRHLTDGDLEALKTYRSTQQSEMDAEEKLQRIHKEESVEEDTTENRGGVETSDEDMDPDEDPTPAPSASGGGHDPGSPGAATMDGDAEENTLRSTSRGSGGSPGGAQDRGLESGDHTGEYSERAAAGEGPQTLTRREKMNAVDRGTAGTPVDLNDDELKSVVSAAEQEDGPLSKDGYRRLGKEIGNPHRDLDHRNPEAVGDRANELAARGESRATEQSREVSHNEPNPDDPSL